MIRRLLHQIRSSRVLHGSSWIMVGLGIQAGLGFLFWLMGSRVATSTELGQASALYTAIQFVNYASGLGLTIALARWAVDRSHESDALFGWAVIATVGSSIVGGCAYLAVVDTEATELVDGTPAGWAVFCAYTAGASIALLVDVRLMAARQWGWLVGRLAVVGLVRLPLVHLDVGMSPGQWLYTLMLAPYVLAGVVGVVMLDRMGAGSLNLARPRLAGVVARYAGVNWLATLTSQAPQFILPLLVAQSVASSINASFFLAWSLTGLVLLVPGAIAQVLLVEGAKDVDPADLQPGHDRAREALRFSLGLAGMAFLGSIVAGQILAAVFGDAYDRLARLLPALMVAGIPWAITTVRLSQARIRRDQVATIAITMSLGLGILVPAVLFVPTDGIDAAVRAWLFGNAVGCAVAMLMHRRAHPRPARVSAIA